MLLRCLRYTNRLKDSVWHHHGPSIIAKADITSPSALTVRSGRQVLQHFQRRGCIQDSRAIHTSRPRYVNPALLAILRPLSKIAAILVGRGFRKWWQSLPADKRALFIQHFLRNKYRYIGGSTLIGAATYTYYEDHVIPAPITGRHRFMVFTSDQLHTIAHHTYHQEISQFADLVMPENHPMVKRVKRVGDQLLRANRNLPQLYTKSWTVTVIDHPTENCYVLPSGDIVMFSGMMKMLENDDQVAAIVAHEMSHAILEHASEQLSRGYLLDILILLPLAVIWAFIPSDGLAIVTQWFLNQVVEILLQLPYSRSLEEEADTVGLQLAAKACFDVREASAFWGTLSLLDKIKKANRKEDTTNPDWLSTHPSNSERQTKIDAQMEEALSIRNFCQCPKLTQQDPRRRVKELEELFQVNSSKTEDSRGL